MSAATIPTKRAKKNAGLAFWMHHVLEECDRASVAFAPDPVHDLRVALRRCCSMAAGIAAIDPDPEWKEMKKAGKRLFRRLGELRDVHVMQEWVHRLDSPDDPVTGPLLQVFADREEQLKLQTVQALSGFDRKRWQRWSRSLPRRIARFRQGSLIFRHLALERWTEAYQLHRQAMHNRSQVGFHRLRVGLKRFRYIVENFLPAEHAAWSEDLKQVQDVLGEVHDLDVLWSAAARANVFPDPEARSRWQKRIGEERARRIESYRKRMLGRDSLWQVWRAQLPDGKQIESAALLRLKLWASLLDPDFNHSMHVTRLALQLYDGLAMNGKAPEALAQDRAILGIAALLHDVGKSKGEKGHHKTSYRMIRRLAPPLGWSARDLVSAGIVARYHRGVLPHFGQKSFRGVSPGQRRDILGLAAILRLANAFDASGDGRIKRVEVQSQNGLLQISAQGYSARGRSAESIAAARHLLETVYHRPVMVKPLRAKRRPENGKQKTENGKLKTENPTTQHQQRLDHDRQVPCAGTLCPYPVPNSHYSETGNWNLEIGHREATQSLPLAPAAGYRYTMTHAQLVEKAVAWLRSYRCGVVLSEQACVSGEMPDAIGWKRASHSVLIECKISRADFLADRDKPFRQKQTLGLGCERFYLAPAGLLDPAELPPGWGLLELRKRKTEVVRPSARDLRTASGLAYEMNLLLASLRRVEIRIEPQTLTDFLKWKNRMLQYNGGTWPADMPSPDQERNHFLESTNP